MAKEYIERDSLIELANNRVDGVIDANDIAMFPAADVVEVVHGRWEYLQDDEWRCSNCHTVFNTQGQWMPMTDNFCSECGADMRERRDNNATD